MVNVDIKQVNIVIEAGADYQMYFVLRDNSNNLIDLTGAVVEAQLREFPEAQDYLQFTATHNGSGGRVSISMPHEDTSAIPYTSGVYDVFITDTDNVRDKYLTGEVAVIPSVTKPVAGEVIYLLSFASEDDFPSYGMVRRLYFSHASNHIYRWNGTDYVDIVTDGEAATVEVGDVETLPAGSNATVENVGSLLNAVFDFGIPEGNGIASIEKTGTDVLTDTYTVTFTDPNVEAFDFDVTNGKGIVSIAEVVSGLTHTFTVTFNDGDTFTYTLTDGNGIVSIEKTGATDNVDHYRITFDDGTYFDYNVTNVDTSEFYDKDDVDDLLAEKADVGDSYTKDEEDALLADKADSADLGDLATKDTVDWDTDIDDIPETFPPSAHNHDDRYYTETETDALLSAKADSSDVYTKTAVDTALALKANSADVYTKDEMDDMLLAKAPVILNSASGSIASFSDGSPAPVTAMSVAIEPVQDLHGYDNPWPAGGGKNLLDYNVLLTWKINGNNIFSVSGNNLSVLLNNSTAHESETHFISLQAGTYTMSSSNKVRMQVSWDGTKQIDTYNTKNVTFTLPEARNDVHIRFLADSYPYDLGTVQIESGSSATSFAPYSNICPISGRTSATVTRTGKNLLNAIHTPMLNGYISGSSKITGTSYDRTLYFPVKTNTTYTVSFTQIAKSTATTNDDFQLGLFSSEPTIDSVGYRLVNRQRTSPTVNYDFTYTFNSQSYTWVGVKICNVNKSDLSGTLATFQLELSSTATPYESYQGQQVTIDLDGTRYGGVIDVLTGELTVTHGYADLGDYTWTYYTSGAHPVFYTGMPDGYTPEKYSSLTEAGVICSIYPNGMYAETRSILARDLPNKSFSWISANTNILIRDDSYSSASDFKTAMSGVQVVYPLKTPITVTLTPSQMQTLLGQNNIWADTGDVSVEYRADTKLFIQGQIAETLDAVKKAKQIITDVTTEMVAPRNLAEGDYVIVGDDLLKTTATVASGSTLTIGINCVKTTVAEALIALATASE